MFYFLLYYHHYLKKKLNKQKKKVFVLSETFNRILINVTTFQMQIRVDLHPNDEISSTFVISITFFRVKSLSQFILFYFFFFAHFLLSKKKIILL
jgi:hypothetical protein